MKYLTKEYWHNFKQDGILFEKLSQVLIEYEYGVNDFIIVGGKDDGGKDINKEIELLEHYTTEIWAQCKYHNKSLSFSDISYTLLMAYIKNTNQILIFSYSKGTKSFLMHMREYRKRTGKSVIIYDDERLEALILKHKDKLYREHREFFDYYPKKTLLKESCFDFHYDLYLNNKLVNARRLQISFNSIMEIVLSITNNSFVRKQINLKVVENRVYKNYEIINPSVLKSYNIEKISTTEVKIYIKLKNYTHSGSLPSFDIENNIISSNIKIDSRWLAETILIGDKYYYAIETINDSFYYPHFHLTYVYGKSGLGKSRLLKEAEKGAIITKKKIIHIDSEKKSISSRRFLEFLFSKITELPFWGDSVKLLTNEKDEFLYFASKVLYDNKFNVAENIPSITKYLATTMINNNYLLILDNIQDFDKTSLEIISDLISYLINNSSETNFIFGINTDYVFGGSVFDKFFNRLKASKANDPLHYSEIEVTGLSKEDSELYIRECLSYNTNNTITTNIKYDKAIRRIVDFCGNSPFFIQQYLLYLYQKEIIDRGIYTLYYFKNIELFLESFNSIPNSIHSLISLREEIMIKKMDSNTYSNYKKFIQLLILYKSIPSDLYFEFINDRDLLNYLCNLGFVSYIDEEITFSHNYYCIFYKKKYNINQISELFINQLFDIIKELHYEERLELTYYWIAIKKGIITLTEINRLINKILIKDYDCIFSYPYYKDFCRCIENNFDGITINKYFAFYRALCFGIDESLGIKKSNFFYKKLIRKYLVKQEKFYEVNIDCISFITQHIIHLINQEKYDDCFTLINSINNVSQNFTNRTQKLIVEFQMNRCLIMIYNRKNCIEEAIVLSNKNLEILNDKKIDEKFKSQYIYSAKRSIGNIYFYSTIASENKSNISNSWRDSYDTFVKKNGFNPNCDFTYQPKVAAYAKGLAAEIISNNELKADIIASFFVNSFNKTDMAYYEMQTRLLYAIYLIWKWSDCFEYNDKLGDIIMLIDEAIDIATVYGRKLTVINAFHLKACVYFIKNDYSRALDNYYITAKMLSKYIKNENESNKWDYFWIDFGRTLKLSSYVQELKLPNKYLEKINHIRYMSEKDFETFEKCYSPVTAFTDKKHSVNFPKI